MRTLQISLDRVTELYRLASVGKLANGLFHNLNGPLHSLGIEMDLINHLILKGRQSETTLVEALTKRLEHMDREFGKLMRLIKLSSERIDFIHDHSCYMNLRGLIEQELEFMEANLFFKHNVRTQLQLDQGLPPLKGMPENFCVGFSWFVQGLVEEIERQQLEALDVKASRGDSGVDLRFILKGAGGSEGLKGIFELDDSSMGGFQVEDLDLGMLLAVLTLKSAGVAVDCKTRNDGLEFSLSIKDPVSL